MCSGSVFKNCHCKARAPVLKSCPLVLTATRVQTELHKLQVTHVVGLPDNATSALFACLQSDSSVRVIPVTREGEAFEIEAGLWMGGQNPVVLIQNTGLLEAGDALRGTVQRMRVPLLCLISYRGYKTLDKAQDLHALDDDRFSRPAVDSAAQLLIPTLNAWGLEYEFIEDDRDADTLDRLFRRAQAANKPFAAIIRGAMQ